MIPLESSKITVLQSNQMSPFELSFEEASYLLAILEADRQTALKLLAADHFYQPSLLPRLRSFQQMLKRRKAMKQDEQP